MGAAVEISIVDYRGDRDLDGRIALDYFVRRQRSVVAVRHEYCLLHYRGPKAVNKNGVPLKSELLQVEVPLRINRAGVFVYCEQVFSSADFNFLLEL